MSGIVIRPTSSVTSPRTPRGILKGTSSAEFILPLYVEREGKSQIDEHTSTDVSYGDYGMRCGNGLISGNFSNSRTTRNKEF